MRVEVRIRTLTRQLAFWDSARRAARGETTARLGVSEPVMPPKRDATLYVLNENPEREFRLVEIREELLTARLARARQQACSRSRSRGDHARKTGRS